MAKNLRAKIPASDTLIVRDINEDAMKRFVAEAQEAARSTGAGAGEGLVEIAENAREVAEKSVWFVPCASNCGSGPLSCSNYPPYLYMYCPVC
jgi:3-hydroxyisobutyrate dehydrogenase